MRIGHRLKLTLILGFGLHFVGYRKSRGNVAPAIFVGAFFCIIQLPVLARPNILFILVDDLAWTDLGSYGHPWHHSPHIDRLATEGMRFTQAYSPAPICSSRPCQCVPATGLCCGGRGCWTSSCASAFPRRSLPWAMLSRRG